MSFGSGLEGKLTAIAVFEQGPAIQRQSVSAGGVAKLWGLADVQIGDRIGESGATAVRPQFPPPTLESVVVAGNPDDRARLRAALTQLAEQDPLINVQQNEVLNEDSVSLYGEVQKEVIESTLETDFGLKVDFQDPSPIHIERPRRSGEAVEVLYSDTNPFRATVGLRIDPAPTNSGIEFRLDIDALTAPLYLYKTLDQLLGAHGAVRPRDAARGPPRLAGHGLRRDDDELRVQRSGRPAVEARPAQHEQRLPQADADRPHAGARARAARACASLSSR